MTNIVDFNEEFQKDMEKLDEDIENVLLTLLNISEIEFESADEFSEVKSYLKYEMKSALVHIIARMQRSRIFDRPVNPRNQE